MHIEALPLWVLDTNAWIVSAGGPGSECVLIDAPPDPSAILARLAALDLRLVAILTTHGHVDHVGGVGPLTRGIETALPVHIHDADRHMLLDPIATSGGLGDMLAYTGIDLTPPELVYGLDDGQHVTGAGMSFTTIATPGHTQGSVCFRLDVDGQAPILFSGDHLFRGGVGRTDLTGGSQEMLMASMAEKILPLDDGVQVLPGHGPRTDIGRERRSNPYLRPLVNRAD